MVLEFKVNSDIELKTFLERNDFSKRIIAKLLLEKKNIFINGKVYDKNYLLKNGDILKICLDENTSVKEFDGQIDIVYEDEFILVVNKPSGLAVIPSRAHYQDNLSSRVLYYFRKTGQKTGIHIVNRLDLMTCGLVIFAKSNYVQSLFNKIETEKKYRCRVDGILREKSGVIDKKIAKSSDGIKREISELGKNALTVYNVLEENGDSSLLDITLKTGRTHQIRVHLSSIGHPLTGDCLYGGKDGEFYLCSYYLRFTLAINNKCYEFNI